MAIEGISLENPIDIHPTVKQIAKKAEFKETNELLVNYTAVEVMNFFKQLGRKPSIEELRLNQQRYKLSKTSINKIALELGYSLEDVEKEWLKSNPLYKIIDSNTKPVGVTDKQVDTAYSHLMFLYDKSDEVEKGVIHTHNICISYIPPDDSGNFYNYMLPVKDITKKRLKNILQLANIFFTPNSCRGMSRGNEFVGSVNAFYVDIDNVNPIEYLNRPDVIEALNKLKPSLIIVTGNGIHIYFKLKKCWANTDKYRRFIAKIQKGVVNFIPSSDKKAVDISRILRLSGSKYVKNGKEVITDTIFESDAVYDIQEVANIVLPLSYENYKKNNDVVVKSANTEKEKDLTKPVQRELIAQRLKKVTNQKGFASTTDIEMGSLKPWTQRQLEVATDIEYLIDINYGDGDKRKRLLFLYGTYLMRVIWTPSIVEDMLRYRNKKFKKPLTDKQFEKVTHSMLISDSKFTHAYNYNYGMGTLVEFIGLDDDIQSKLKVIRGRNIKDRERYQRNKPELTEKQKELEDLKKSIKKMYFRKADGKYIKSGITLKEVAVALNIELSKVKRLVQKL